MKISTVHSIDVQDFDKLVKETYGRPYMFQQQDGCKPRGVHKFTVPCENPEDYENETIPEKVNGYIRGVSFAAWLARDPKQPLKFKDEWDETFDFSWRLDLCWERNFYPSLDMIVNDLHERGLLPAGKYQMVIDW